MYDLGAGEQQDRWRARATLFDLSDRAGRNPGCLRIAKLLRV